MTVKRLQSGKASGFRIGRGTVVKCLSGTVWVTASGEDIILEAGNSISWKKKACRAAVLSISADAVIAVGRNSSFLEEFPLLHEEAGLAGSLAG